MPDRVEELVSIIIPVYNGAWCLKETLESVRSQTYANFEIIVVNDGSTDESELVIQSFDDHRVRYVFQPNKGVCAARNKGLSLARGSIIGFLDQDDRWLPDKLQVQLHALKENPGVDVVSGGFQSYGKEGMGEVVIFPPSLSVEDIVMKGYGLLLSATLFRASVFDRVGRFDEEFISGDYEDREFSLRVASVSKIVLLPQVVVMKWASVHTSDKIWDAHIHNRGRYLKKCLERYGSHPRIFRKLQYDMVGYWADLGKRLILKGRMREGREALLKAIWLSVTKQLNMKMGGRSFLRLLRTVSAGRR